MKKEVQIIKSNTLGMFDLLKGVAMLLIVIAHNSSLFPELELGRIPSISNNGALSFFSFGYLISLLIKLILAFGLSIVLTMVPALLIIAGYGFRKKSIDKAWRHYAKELLRPYFITVIVVIIFEFCIHYAFFRWIPGALEETAKVLGGMVYGVTQTREFGQITLFANGAVWFLLAMFWALVLYNIVVNCIDDKYVIFVSIGISIIGWILSFWKYTPFGLSQGLVAVLYIHIGYRLKKSKALISKHSLKEIVLYFLVCVVPNILLLCFGMITNMADNVYSLGPISYIASGLWGVGILSLFLKLNKFTGVLVGGIRIIGRYSLYVMCVHSVEMITVPWYILTGRFENGIIGFFVILFARLLFITVGCMLIVFIKKRLKRAR